MLVPLSWLRDYVDITLSAEELAEKLTIAGLEVEAINYVGIPGGNNPDRLVWDRDLVVVGHILRVDPHPNADRLVLATVDYGGDEPEVTVTGAPNLFQYLDAGDLSDRRLYAPFAMEGAVLYDGHKEGQVKTKLKSRSLRGIPNRCMLCSEKELGLSSEHEGIMLLEGEQAPGTPLQDVLGDVVFDIAIIPNIARAASIIGVAREVAALTGQEVRYPDYDVVQTGPSIDGQVTITTANPDLNPRFVALVIEGVTQEPSPRWMQRRLLLAGQRPINVVVDVSNYVMLEMGQPNHAFDYDFLKRRAGHYDPDGPVHIHTRLAEPGETLTTLDGIERELEPFNILVTDPAGALSLGGIMGGAESEIGDETTTVLLEAAAWNYINIRRSSSALKLNSEAGFRFSRGVHPSQALLGAKRAAELLRRYAGGTVAQGIVDYYPNPPETPTITLTPAEVTRIAGITLDATEIAGYLRALEFDVTIAEEALHVTPPDHRLDIEGTHDLIEEVCRMYGYDRLPSTELADTLPPLRVNRPLLQEEEIKDTLVRLGLQEVITYRLTTPERENRLLPAATGAQPDQRPYVTLANPITVDRVTMRHSLLASILEIIAANSRFQAHQALFEIGPIYLASEAGDLPDELTRLVIALTGPRLPEHWQASDAEAYDFFDLKGIVEALLDELHIGPALFEPAKHPSFRPGRTARIEINDRQLGILGEIHPLVVEALDIRAEHPVLAADLDLNYLQTLIPDRFLIRPVTPYPAVHEDLAVVVDRSVPADAVLDVIRRAGGRLLRGVTLFDLYEGRQLAQGKRSLAYHLTFQSDDTTLTDKRVSQVRNRIIRQLEQELGARLRA